MARNQLGVSEKPVELAKKMGWKACGMCRVLKKYGLLFLKEQNQKLELLACHAMQWRGLADAPLHPKHLFDEHRAAFCRQHFRPGMSFLDLGSGVGTECIAAAKAGAMRVVGIENDRRNYRQAVSRAKKAGVKVDFILHNLEDSPLPIDSKSFDLINMSNVLEHLTGRVAVLSELRRVKKEVGVAVISVPNVDTSWKRALRSVGLDSRDDDDHKIEYTKELLVAELREAGLEITSPLLPIIPSFPWNGLIALSAVLSPNLYRRLQRYKYRFVARRPQESIGWNFIAQ
jgi:2-polyprenyl-3-methyl-5-hydroxy-6-metoxy-1,4-benzoquinol methylase